MKCQSCGFENTAESKFCIQCGKELVSGQEQPVAPQQQPTQYAEKNTCSLAIASLVLGICSFAGFWCLSGIPAIITGHMARRKIKESKGTLTGDGLAVAGLATGYVGTVGTIFIALLLAAIAVPNFIRARDDALAKRCVNNMRLISAAKDQFAIENKAQGTYVPTAEELSIYFTEGHMPTEPTGSSYTINAIDQNPTCNSGKTGHTLERDSD